MISKEEEKCKTYISISLKIGKNPLYLSPSRGRPAPQFTNNPGATICTQYSYLFIHLESPFLNHVGKRIPFGLLQ